MLTGIDFLSRMDNDAHERRRTQYINDMSELQPADGQRDGRLFVADQTLIPAEKHPHFKPSMLKTPKPKFKTVTLDGGPIIKVHESRKTGQETGSRRLSSGGGD
ncbi:MAG: hypothetical protein SGPRY_010924 [Prymnesium sp.]